MARFGSMGGTLLALLCTLSAFTQGPRATSAQDPPPAKSKRSDHQISESHSFTPEDGKPEPVHTLIIGHETELPKFWNLSGSAKVAHGGIELTSNEPTTRTVGGIWNTEPLVGLHDWEVKIQFHASNTKDDSKIGGDGFVFWFTTEQKGAVDLWTNDETTQPTFKGLALVFDSFDDDDDGGSPTISAIASLDGLKKYDKLRDGTLARIEGAVCKVQYRNRALPAAVKVFYIGKTLSVYYDLFSSGTYHPCFSRENIELPNNAYVGLTSSVPGDRSSNDAVQIYSFEFFNNNPSDIHEVHAERLKEKHDEARPFLIKPMHSVYRWLTMAKHAREHLEATHADRVRYFYENAKARASKAGFQGPVYPVDAELRAEDTVARVGDGDALHSSELLVTLQQVQMDMDVLQHAIETASAVLAEPHDHPVPAPTDGSVPAAPAGIDDASLAEAVAQLEGISGSLTTKVHTLGTVFAEQVVVLKTQVGLIRGTAKERSGQWEYKPAEQAHRVGQTIEGLHHQASSMSQHGLSAISADRNGLLAMRSTVERSVESAHDHSHRDYLSYVLFAQAIVFVCVVFRRAKKPVDTKMHMV